MCISSKKKIEKNRTLIKENSGIFEVFETIAKNDPQLVKDLQEVQKKVEVLIPSDEKEVIKIDNQIAKKIKKLRKVIEKNARKNNFKKTRKILTQIEILAVERGFTNRVTLSSDDKDFVVENGKLIKYVGNGGDVILPNTVKIIGKKVFDNNNTIGSIVAPEGLTTIEESAFNLCRALKSVVFPSTLVMIDQSAFFGCASLETVSMEKGVSTINHYAFAKCPVLRAVTIPSTVSKIGDSAFQSDKSLKHRAKRKIKKINKRALK